MRLDISQHLRMTQQMKLAPRMIQSMEILQLPVMALEERVREEIESNATLELGTSTTEVSTTDLEAGGDPNPAPAEERHGAAEREPDSVTGPSDQEFETYERMAEEWNENAYAGPQLSRGASAELADKRYEAMLNMEDRPVSLEDFLLEQLAITDESALVTDFARHIIGNLNDHGFVVGWLHELRSAFDRPITDDEAEMALLMVQALDPAGVGARDLRECLLLQLEEPHPDWNHVDAVRTLVADHLDDVAHNRLPLIEKRTGLARDVIREAIGELGKLALNPAARFESSKNQYVVPDVTVFKDEDDAWQVRGNDQNMPHVRVSKHYLEMLRDKNADPGTLEYVKRKITSARWLIDAIEQRRATLEKVTRAIVERQRGFLESGPEAIEPLKMQEIAEKVGVHVTTVSRAVDGKWVQTPLGFFPLKRFFGGGTTTATGEEVAWETIKRKLTDLINAEDKTSPLADDDIVKKLAEQGYPLARRTVTKYRKMLNIPTSRQRKAHV